MIGEGLLIRFPLLAVLEERKLEFGLLKDPFEIPFVGFEEDGYKRGALEIVLGKSSPAFLLAGTAFERCGTDTAVSDDLPPLI